MKFFCTALVSAFLLVAAQSAAAQSWIFGLGYADFSDDNGVNGATFGVDYRFPAFHEAKRFSAGWAIGAGATEHGDAYLGVGLMATYDLADRWFIEGGFLPGVYYDSEDGNDLGSTFEIRSLLGLGYRLKNGSAISLAISHLSNASTSERNPGLNTVTMRWHMPIQR